MNLVRAVRSVRGLVAEIVDQPVEVLDRLVVVGRGLRVGPVAESPAMVMWSLVDRAVDVDWDQMLDDAAGELVAGLGDRARRGLRGWGGSLDDMADLWAVVMVEATARAFGPLAAPDEVEMLHIPWEVATKR